MKIPMCTPIDTRGIFAFAMMIYTSLQEYMEFNFRRYSMHTSLFLYVGNLILLCKLCHYIMQIAI